MATLPISEPQAIDLDPHRLADAYGLLEEWSAGAEAPVPGAALLVGRHGKMLATRWFGKQGPEAGADAIRQDGLFLLASITKPMTYLAAMTLVERGRLNLSDRVTDYIPEFAAHHKEDTQLIHLFTHTSGMPDMLQNNVELRRRHAPLQTFVEGAIRDTVPLFRAGTSVRYQSMGTLAVAEIVQRLTGMSLHEYLQQTVFRPLGLTSTSLGVGDLDPARIVRVQTPPYQADGDFGWNSDYWRRLGSPWGGMFSTPNDLAVVAQLMLNRGVYANHRVVSPRTVERMTTNRLHDLPEVPEPLRRTQPWGLGWRMNHPAESDSWGDLLGRRVYGHTGATGTMMWIDPDADGFCILLTSARLAVARRRLAMVSNSVASAFL